MRAPPGPPPPAVAVRSDTGRRAPRPRRRRASWGALPLLVVAVLAAAAWATVVTDDPSPPSTSDLAAADRANGPVVGDRAAFGPVTGGGTDDPTTQRDGAAPAPGAADDTSSAVDRGPARTPSRAVARSADGFLVAPGLGAQAGAAPPRTFTVEVEPETGVDLAEFTVLAEEALLDPRSWTADPTIGLQRVADPDEASLRVVLARPATVDRFCAQAGLDTNGLFSCFDGRRAMLNLDRWQGGAPGFSGDLDTYRRYLVNHEVGHGLGFGHVGCPASGELAPVMMQQSKSTGACAPNAWPFPDVAP